MSNDILRRPMRKRNEIEDYELEASEKVWFMRSEPSNDPVVEARRMGKIENIIETYNDIPEYGYTGWECGYWNGIMAALRWVLGDEKDFLDT